MYTCIMIVLQIQIIILIMVLPTINSIISTTRQRPSSNFNTIVNVKSINEAKCNFYSNDDVSLTNYMGLPVAQYAVIDMPMQSTLSRIKDTENEFLLEVPCVKFFHLLCKPTVYCTVTKSDDGKITITSDKCILSGSPMIDSLNEHYKFNVITQFTWKDTKHQRVITSNSKILVLIDPPSIFKAFPKSLLESTGNLVMQLALGEIEKLFIKSLSKDYSKWATNKAYRDERAAM